MSGSRQQRCHPEPPKDTKCRRTVEGPPDCVPCSFSAARPRTWGGGPSTVLRRRCLPGVSAANRAAAPAAQDDSILLRRASRTTLTPALVTKPQQSSANLTHAFALVLIAQHQQSSVLLPRAFQRALAPVLMAQPQKSSVLLPRAFQRGRRCRRRMRGLSTRSASDITSKVLLPRISASSIAGRAVGSAPSSAFGTFSPTKGVGEKDARLGSLGVWIIARVRGASRLEAAS
ncbi:MAG: hypothetical protein QOK37_3458 [Thermoanaerobaculia bacterium]|nr:hypothetical protein [Thermoanaerobaculia bacterium]